MVEEHGHDRRAEAAAAQVSRNDDVVDPGTFAVGDRAGEPHDASIAIAGGHERRRRDDRRADVAAWHLLEPVEVLQEIEDVVDLVGGEPALEADAAIVEVVARPQEGRRAELREAREKKRRGVGIAWAAPSPQPVDDLAALVERSVLTELDGGGHAIEPQASDDARRYVRRMLERALGLRGQPVRRVVDRGDVLVGTDHDALAQELTADAEVQLAGDKRPCRPDGQQPGPALRDAGHAQQRGTCEEGASFGIGARGRRRRHRVVRPAHGSRMARGWYLEKVQIREFC